MKLIMSGVDYHSMTAGPHNGDGRTVIFTQGCLRAASGNPCPGCFNPETWPLNSEKAWRFTPRKLAAILNEMMPNDLLTISGGEPFIQAKALTNMLEDLRRMRPNLHVIIYSGYTLTNLLYRGIPGFCTPMDATRLLKQVDMLIDGEYIESKNIWNPKDGYIGSSNQRVYDKKQLLRAIDRRWDSD